MNFYLLLLNLGLSLYPCAHGAALNRCMQEAVKLVGPRGRVSLLQALPKSKRYAVALVLNLKDGSKVLAIGGGVTVGHVDMIRVARRRYPDQIEGSQLWGEVTIENQRVKLGVGEITEATPTSGTWWKSYSSNPEYKNTARGLVEALAAQEAIRVNAEGVRGFDSEAEHLSPILVGRHRAASIVCGTLIKLESMVTQGSGERVTEANFKQYYTDLAPMMESGLPDFTLYLDGMVNDGAMTLQTRRKLQREIEENFGREAAPTLAKMEKLYANLQAALKPAADISKNPEPYIEFISIPAP